ncbi:MAG: hypothetical protein KGH54_03510 [Candidatus Micrarchaeota archaeon]|nr:hypothetical protein [Candidatus Micrarchaeota archaeon]
MARLKTLGRDTTVVLNPATREAVEQKVCDIIASKHFKGIIPNQKEKENQNSRVLVTESKTVYSKGVESERTYIIGSIHLNRLISNNVWEKTVRHIITAYDPSNVQRLDELKRELSKRFNGNFEIRLGGQSAKEIKRLRIDHGEALRH